MLGPCRRIAIVTGLALAWLASLPGAARAQGGKPSAPATAPDEASKLPPGEFALPGEDPPRAFVPAHPRTSEERKRVESLRDYAVGRAFEERRQFGEAVKSFEKALASDPNSLAALRRLSRINIGLNNVEAGVAFGRKVLETDPGDIETIELLIRHSKDDPAASEALLKEIAANPKLEKNSAGALYIDYELAGIYEGSLQFDKAAEALAKVVEALDDNSNVKLNPAELRRFLGTDEAQSYLRFGRIFFQAKKFDLAIRSFRRGLVYEPDDPSLLIALSQVYLATDKAGEALEFVERFLKRQPRGRETYDLLARILASLKREEEIIPRFEKYAAADPKNLPLQYALAERYKAAGQIEKALEIFKVLMADQRDTQEFAEAFPRLIKERKAEELLTLLTRVFARLKRFDAVEMQIELLAADPAFTDEVIDAGLKMLSSDPPRLDLLEGYNVLRKICYQGKRYEKLAVLLRWSLKRIPNAFTIYQELILVDVQLARFDDAEALWKEMMEKYPEEKSAKLLLLLGEVQVKAGQFDRAIATFREATKLDPADSDAVRLLAEALIAAGREDEGVAVARDASKAAPNDPDLLFGLSRVLIKVRRMDDAIATLKALLERFPNDDKIGRVVHSNLSIVYSELNDFPKAEAELEIIFAKEPEDPGINNDLGYLYADQGKNLEKAETMIRKAVAEEPDNYAYLDSLGWVLFKRGKFDEARVPLEKAQADPLADSTIPDHLGDVYFQLQEPTKARACWEKALKMASESRPPDRRVGEIRKKIQSLQQFVPTPKPKTGDKP